MSAPDDSAEREFEATERKLDEARTRGELPRMADLTAAAAMAGFLLALTIGGGAAVQAVGGSGAVLIGQADRFAAEVATQGRATVGGWLGAMAGPLAPLFLVPGALAVALLVGLRGLVVAPARIAPQLSRLSPLSGLKQRFGADGLFEFAKSTVKLGAVAAVLSIYLGQRIDAIAGAVALAPGPAVALMARLLAEFLGLIVGLQVAIGLADLLWQRHSHLRRQRMTRREMLDEMKNAEGDPHLKAARRQRGVDIATNRMIADVATANVVVVNPTHYAVALKWARSDRHPPVCVAKGTDAVAARIRAAAAEAGVPVHSDPPTARALHATVELGEPIRPEHYRAVAAAIRFAEAMRLRARARGAPPPTGTRR
jgi:flagellar biosynthetic protein FlhB